MMANLLDLIIASGSPLDARDLSVMLHDMENTPCVAHIGVGYVVWPSVWYEGTEYILVQMPNDDLVALQGQREFWTEALALEREEEDNHEVDDGPCNCNLCREEEE